MQPHLESLPPHVAQRLQTLKLLSFSLMLGVIMFGIVVAAIAPLGAPMNPNTLNIMRLVCGVLFMTGFVIAIVLRQTAKTKLVAMQPPADDAIRANYFVGVSITTMAVFEGPALLACVIALLSGNPLELVLALPCLLLMMWYFPTASRWRNFGTSSQDQFMGAR